MSASKRDWPSFFAAGAIITPLVMLASGAESAGPAVVTCFILMLISLISYVVRRELQIPKQERWRHDPQEKK